MMLVHSQFIQHILIKTCDHSLVNIFVWSCSHSELALTIDQLLFETPRIGPFDSNKHLTTQQAYCNYPKIGQGSEVFLLIGRGLRSSFYTLGGGLRFLSLFYRQPYPHPCDISKFLLLCAVQ